jgi:hypothetical protein
MEFFCVAGVFIWHFCSLFVVQEALTLGDSALPKIKVHPTVVFSILNNFTRRSPRDSRVIGTLLGNVKDGVVTVSFYVYTCQTFQIL